MAENSKIQILNGFLDEMRRISTKRALIMYNERLFKIEDYLKRPDLGAKFGGCLTSKFLKLLLISREDSMVDNRYCLPSKLAVI
jgi:hypothetical protein